MDSELTEKQVLEVLDIPDFRHMTKDKVMSFASMLSNMQPEVAMKALEQFPEFSKTILELATDYKAAIEKGFDGNDASMKSCHEILQTIIDSLKTQVEREDIPFEERKYYIDKMFEVATMQNQKDSENKNFIGKVLQIATAAVLVLGGLALGAIGGKVDFRLPTKKL